MQLVWCDTPDAFDSAAADGALQFLANKPDLVVALPTGRTPIGLYSELRAHAAAGSISFAQARWFDLDEYVGLGATHPLSYAQFIRTHLLDGIGALDSHVRLLRGDVPDPEAECRDYDQAIADVGGLDLAILGLGANGHIAFNEPGSAWDKTTHVTDLTAQTRAANSQMIDRQSFVPAESLVPRTGITMGIATLRRSRHVLLLVAGETKREALRALRRGLPDPNWPVTSLLGHPDLTVIADSRLRSPVG